MATAQAHARLGKLVIPAKVKVCARVRRKIYRIIFFLISFGQLVLRKHSASFVTASTAE